MRFIRTPRARHRADSGKPRLAECNGCELDLARLVNADRGLTGEVNKVSTLIGSLRLSIFSTSRLASRPSAGSRPSMWWKLRCR